MLNFFDSIVISGEIGWRKPNSILFLKLATSLNLVAKEIVFVGDDPNYDVKGAKAAGMIAILITQGAEVNSKYYEENEKPDYEIKNINEIVNLLKVID
ncbi:MAG: HAD-IA family hydrolase [Candidatus Bathyarchaeia archaeon]